MDSTRKRPLSSSEWHNAQAIKKSKTCVNINTLPYQQRAIVEQAAEILHVDYNILPAAINFQYQYFDGYPGYPNYPVQPSYDPTPIPARRMHKPKLKPTSKSLKRSSSSNENSDKFNNESSSNDVRGSNIPRMNLIPPHVPRDSTYNFAKPAFLTSCFSSCLSDSSSYENSYDDRQLPPARPMMEAKPAIIPDYATSSTTSLLSPNSNDHLAFNGFQESLIDDISSDFACNLDFNSLSYPTLQPIQLHSQPVFQNQEMTYVQMSSSSYMVPWNQPQQLNSTLPNEYSQAPIIDSDTSHISVKVSPSDSDADNSSDSVTTVDKQGPSRRGPFKTAHEREQTAQTRKNAACVRCRIQRIRCIPDPLDPTGICLTCQKVKSTNMKPNKPQCLRYKIPDVKLFKPGQVPGYEWTQRWSTGALDQIDLWASTEVKVIQITDRTTQKSIPISVCRFQPLEGDMLDRRWVAPGGVQKSVELPPYAIVDTQAAREIFEAYINEHGPEFFKGALDYNDQFLWHTYTLAFETANDANTPDSERLLLKMLLRLWVAVRLTTRSMSIIGDETLGMPPDILDETSPIHGSIPIPPVMGAQLDFILIQQIEGPLRDRVLEALQKVVLSNKRTSWFTIYLCTFVLLHNCALITKHDHGYARKHGMQRRFARPEMVAEYHMGANILLAYFHYCNKGGYPFGPEGDKADIVTVANLTPKQKTYVDKTRKHVRMNMEKFEGLRWQEAYENDFYWIAQLFEVDWKPRHTTTK